MGKNVVATVARYLLGIGFLVFGLNGFLGFIPMEMGGEMATLMGILAESGYIYIVKVLEILIGIALLANKYVPFSLVLAAPLTINFVLFHLFWDPASIVGAAVFFVLNMYLIHVNKSAYKGMCKA